MSSVNFELMQSLLQVTPQSKTFESASTTSDSSVSFETILSDMNDKGITLTQEEVATYKETLEENNVDLEELHKVLSALTQFENIESSEDTEGKSLLDVLLEAFKSTEETTNEEVEDKAVIELAQAQVVSSMLVEPVTSNEKVNTENDTKEVPVIETEEVKIEVESVKPTVTDITEMASVNSSTISIDTNHETIKSETTFSETLTNEKQTVKNTYVAKPVYHEVNFDTNENVIISDDSVLKLDLMFKGMFTEEDATELSTTVNVDKEVKIEEPLLTAENVEVISKEETADFEKAYMTLNTIRPITQSLSVNSNPEYRTENVNASKLVANEFGWETPIKVNLTEQITNGFAKQVDLSDEFVIKLKPEGLGEIVVKMVSDATGNASVTMITNNQHVKALLESDMVDLRNALLNQHVEVKEVVYDDQSSYFSESNFMDQSNKGHGTKEQSTFSYYQPTNDEQDVIIAPTNTYYYGSSRLHQYA